MSFDRVIELVSFVEVQVEPGIHFLERNCGSPRKSEGMRLAIHLHEAADVAGHADILRRGIEMGWEITGVGRVAEDTVALLVRRMLDGVSGHGMAGKAESIARRGKSDVGGAFHVSDRVAGGAAHGDSGVDVLPWGLVAVALATFGGISFCGEKDGMLVKVGARRRSEKQQDDRNQGVERKTKQWRV
ncbi:MAG: hypothetical protein WCB53_18610 [Terriglobales bacterium]